MPCLQMPGGGPRGGLDASAWPAVGEAAVSPLEPHVQNEETPSARRAARGLEVWNHQTSYFRRFFGNPGPKKEVLV